MEIFMFYWGTKCVYFYMTRLNDKIIYIYIIYLEYITTCYIFLINIIFPVVVLV